jgi:DNA-binding cell septation regulator SpoVG
MSWFGLVIDGIPVREGKRGPFVAIPTRRGGNGVFYPLFRFLTVADREAFKTEVLAALMKAYPEDFEGFEAEEPERIAGMMAASRSTSVVPFRPSIRTKRNTQ